MSKILLNTLASKREKAEGFLWLDWFAYGQRIILNNNDIPWQDTVKLIDFMGKGQSLLNQEVISFPLEKYFNWWLETNAPLREEMAGKKRVGYALKTFLANERLREQLQDIVKNAATALRVPFVLSTPSPRTLLSWAHSNANNLNPNTLIIEEAMADNAAVYLADFLRIFAPTELAGLLFIEADDIKLDREQLDIYQPISNIAATYHWTVGVHSGDSTQATSTWLDFMISSHKDACSIVLHPLGKELRSSAALHKDGKMFFCTVPEDAEPESVLNALKEIMN